MASKIPAEILPYKPKPPHPIQNGGPSYAPNGGPSLAQHHGYGQNTGKANAQTGNVPTGQPDGNFEVAALPAYPDTITVGDGKNVSTPVTG